MIKMKIKLHEGTVEVVVKRIVKIGSYKFMLHRYVKGWALSEINTGKKLCAEKTMKKTVAMAQRYAENMGVETFNAKIGQLLINCEIINKV